MKTLLIAVCAVVIGVAGCKKESTNNGPTAADVQLAKTFDSTIQGRYWELEDYYAADNDPFIYTDTIPNLAPETNFYKFVPDYIKDDYNSFNSKSGVATITQNALRIETNPNPVFTNGYYISADKEGVYFDFLNYQYEPLTYRLVDLQDSSFIVSANYNHHKVFSKFHVVKQ